MLGTMKEVDPRYSKRITALQESLGLDNETLAAKFGVGTRTFISWKYKERNPSKTAIRLLEMFEKQAKLA